MLLFVDAPAVDASYDAVVVGSGFGGALAAHELVHAGWRVLMLERGAWVRRGPHNWAPGGVGPLTPAYSLETPYRVLAGGEADRIGAFECVGGPSVFYGGVSLRFRTRDFEPATEIAGDSGARWPFGYDDLEPYYSRAEHLLGVAGDPGGDPTEPPRSAPYPHPPGALSPTSRLIWQAARELDLRPFRLPLALNHARASGRAPCAACGTCDLFACAISAKNDLATAVIPELMARGMRLLTRTVVVRLAAEAGRVRAVECVERDTGRRRRFEAGVVILAAGALASPHLVLASGLERLSPAAAAVGRYLTRHYNAIAAGFFPRRPDPENQFHKQVGIHDFYFGSADGAGPPGRLGGMQQLPTPPRELVKAHLPKGVGGLVAPLLSHVTGLLVMAEDQPSAQNGVAIDPRSHDRFGLPQLLVTHRYSPRDAAAGDALLRQARRILRRAGALFSRTHLIRTFSHAVGTLRMGDDPQSAPLDADGRFRGLENLYVTDASAFPTAAGVNPSLTIAANALRVAERLLGRESGHRGAAEKQSDPAGRPQASMEAPWTA